MATHVTWLEWLKMIAWYVQDGYFDTQYHFPSLNHSSRVASIGQESIRLAIFTLEVEIDFGAKHDSFFRHMSMCRRFRMIICD